MSQPNAKRFITIAASALAGGAVILVVSTPSLTDRFQALYEQVMRMPAGRSFPVVLTLFLPLGSLTLASHSTA